MSLGIRTKTPLLVMLIFSYTTINIYNTFTYLINKAK